MIKSRKVKKQHAHSLKKIPNVFTDLITKWRALTGKCLSLEENIPFSLGLTSVAGSGVSDKFMSFFLTLGSENNNNKDT